MAKIQIYRLCLLLLVFWSCDRVRSGGVTLPETSELSETINVPVIPEIPVVVLEPEPEPIPEPVVVKPTLTDIYLSQVGVRELTGKNDGPEVEMYLRSVGLGKGYAWCGAYVKWCLDEADIPNKINAWSPTAENKKHLVYSARSQIEEPRPGDVFTLYYVKLKRIGHTGFYHKRVNSSIYESVEGNTNQAGSREGDGVYRKYRSFNATHSISRWE